jgi:kinesin family member 15
MVNNVMQGYNACCFAYGQTGAGKTHTMQGDLALSASGSPQNPMRGLAPRVFHQIFHAVERKEGEAQGVHLKYTCRCSFLQIYNEQISDLLRPGDKPLALRYDNNTGVYVENLTEEVVVNGALH